MSRPPSGRCRDRARALSVRGEGRPVGLDVGPVEDAHRGPQAHHRRPTRPGVPEVHGHHVDRGRPPAPGDEGQAGAVRGDRRVPGPHPPGEAHRRSAAQPHRPEVGVDLLLLEEVRARVDEDPAHPVEVVDPGAGDPVDRPERREARGGLPGELEPAQGRVGLAAVGVEEEAGAVREPPGHPGPAPQVGEGPPPALASGLHRRDAGPVGLGRLLRPRAVGLAPGQPHRLLRREVHRVGEEPSAVVVAQPRRGVVAGMGDHPLPQAPPVEVPDVAAGPVHRAAAGLVHRPQAPVVQHLGPQVHRRQARAVAPPGGEQGLVVDGQPLDDPVGLEEVGPEEVAEDRVPQGRDAADGPQVHHVGELVDQEQPLPVVVVVEDALGPRRVHVAVDLGEGDGGRRAVGGVHVVGEDHLHRPPGVVAEERGELGVGRLQVAPGLQRHRVAPVGEVDAEVGGDQGAPVEARVHRRRGPGEARDEHQGQRQGQGAAHRHSFQRTFQGWALRSRTSSLRSS